MSIVLYGIKNCDTVKKARRWLDVHQIEYTFHDFRTDGLNKKMLKDFLKQVDWEILLNMRGTTWRNLSENQRNDIDKHKALDLMLEFPAIIKRPVLNHNNELSVGFNESQYIKDFL